MQIAQVAPLTEAIPPKLYGGTERVVYWLVEELVALGHDVSVIAAGDGDRSGHPSARFEANVRVLRVPDRERLFYRGGAPEQLERAQLRGIVAGVAFTARLAAMIQRHARAWDLPRLAGWWGHDEQSRFDMGPNFQPMPGADGWQLSNPSIVSLAALRASMEIFHEAGMERLRAKSISLTGYLEFLLSQNSSANFSIITPREKERRGAQLSVRVPQNGRALCERLAREGIVGDWRERDTFRVAPVPLYNSYRDVFRFVQRFAAAVG